MKLLLRMSDGKFSVFTLSYVNTALNQSAFIIQKCYIRNKIIYIYSYTIATDFLYPNLNVAGVSPTFQCLFINGT